MRGAVCNAFCWATLRNNDWSMENKVWMRDWRSERGLMESEVGGWVVEVGEGRGLGERLIVEPPPPPPLPPVEVVWVGVGEGVGCISR